MAKEYRHLKMYEEEILELKEQGLTQREIALRYGVTSFVCKGKRRFNFFLTLPLEDRNEECKMKNAKCSMQKLTTLK